MKVLYLTINPNRESTTVPTEGWFTNLRSRGLEPVLVSHTSGRFQQWASDQGIPCYERPLPFPAQSGRAALLAAVARVTWIAWKHGVDLVHCNEHDVYPIGQYAARLLRIPVVVSIHFTLRDGFSQWAFGGSRQPRRMFFVSESNREACRPDLTGIVPEDRWRILHNGLNLEYYRPDDSLRRSFREVHGLGDAILVGAACALRPRKQLEHLFGAVARLPSARLVLAGGAVTGDEAYAEALLGDARRLLGDRFLYIGHQQDLRPLYNALDLFVNTSQEEAFGLSVLEAMSCGCPVVGYPSVSVGEVVLPGGGQIVPQDDLDGLVEAIARSIADPSLRSGLRTAARSRSEHFDIRRISEQLWAEYGQVQQVQRGQQVQKVQGKN